MEAFLKWVRGTNVILLIQVGCTITAQQRSIRRVDYASLQTALTAVLRMNLTNVRSPVRVGWAGLYHSTSIYAIFRYLDIALPMILTKQAEIILPCVMFACVQELMARRIENHV